MVDATNLGSASSGIYSKDHQGLKVISQGCYLIPMGEAITVLHVEDDQDLAELAATYLEREDDRLEVRSVPTPEECLDLLGTDDFDGIISDYDLPDKNGIELLTAVRETHPHLPFILFTGKGSEEVAGDAISAGVTDYLQKEIGTSQFTVLANRLTNAIEQHRARQEVEETEQKLSQLAERTDDILFMFNGDRSELLFINSAFEDIWGESIDELQANPQLYLESIHPDDRERAVEAMETIASGEEIVIEYRVMRTAEDQRWIRGKTKPIFDEEGAVTRIVGYVRDITEHKERERRLDAIFNNTHTFVGLLEPDGTVLEVNETALSFGGLALEDVQGEPIWETFWIQGDEATQAILRDGVEQAREGDSFRAEIEVQGDDRDAIVDFTIRPVTNEAGEVILLVPEGRDITERIEEERKREQIIDRVTDSIIEVDAEWQITLVNEQAVELSGMSEDHLLGSDFWEVFHGAKGTRFEEEYRAVMETGEATSIEEYFGQVDTRFYIEVYPKDDGGLAFYFIAVDDGEGRTPG